MRATSSGGYRGPIRLAVFDMAGTIVDYGSRAPAGVFEAVFASRGVAITNRQARGPMGMAKRAHIAALAHDPAIAVVWRQVHGCEATDGDIDGMYADFVPLQLECLAQHSDVIPGAVEAFAALRDRGVKIATTTGYSRRMTDVVLDAMRAQELTPDLAICADDVPEGRPRPWMLFRCMERLDVSPPAAVVKVGDTIADIEAGLNAGVWTIGIARTGNLVGLSQDELKALPQQASERCLEEAHAAMRAAGAHDVVDSVADCLPAIERFEMALAEGGRP